MKNWISIVLCLIVMNGFSQQKSISLLEYKIQNETSEQVKGNAYYQLAEIYFTKSQLDSAYHYATKSWKVFESQKKDSLSFLTTQLLVQITSKTHQNENTYYLKRIEEKAQKISNKKMVSQVFMELGTYFYSIQKDDLAMQFRLKADEINTAYQIKNRTVVSNLTGIAQLLIFSKKTSNSRNFDRAEKYVIKALQIAEEIQNDTAIGAVYEKYAHLQAIKEEYDVAKKYLFKGLKASQNVKDTLRESSIYLSLARVQEAKKQKDSALFYYQKRIAILSTSTQKKELGFAYLNMGDFLLEEEHFPEAVVALERARNIFNQKVDQRNELEIKTLKTLAKAYSKNNQPIQAYATLSLATKKNDSTLIAQNDAQVLELETKYQTEKKEQAIQLLATENKLEKNKLYVVVTLMLLLLISALFLGYHYNNKIKTAQKIQELNELKSIFFTNISHEFRTPLTLIKSPLQSLQKEITKKNQLDKLQLIDQNSNRMLELINQLLALSKIDSGNLKLLLKKGIVIDFLQNVIAPFRFEANENNKIFEVRFTENRNAYYFDKDVLEKILSNLLSNAFKYTSEKDTIIFEAIINDAVLTLIVSNTGTQINEEDLPQLFERFYQKKETNAGFGIGLALVKELVDLYQGTIHAQVHKDTLTFQVALPLQKEHHHAVLIEEKEISLRPHENSTESNVPLLLIVEDNADIRNLLISVLQDSYTILEAKDGMEGLEIAEKEIPDCIISDIMMPKLNGYELTQQIKSNELTSFIPVILLTADASEKSQLQGIKSAADAFLTKPFHNEILRETITQILQERKKLQERYRQELILKPTEIVVDSYDEKFIARLEIILDKNLSNPDFTTEIFANEANISRMQLHRKLKSLFGVSATEFIRNERLKLAYQLLQKPNVTVSEVAYAVGFNEITYFSKCFKDYFSVPPSSIQKQP
ncbi:response regulator [Flavobacterium sp. TP390]|uniref:histidine kinase n=1 Tax=Flavobacterium profundi TaxID=1774945 RepID=A0A6I4ITM7_9FLAO|nr:response regulator [Flavobacterium profundi]MVO10223.1 response regulator [Flavobacterium profundi]